MPGWQIYTYLIISFTLSKHCSSICFLSCFCHCWACATKSSIQRNFLTCTFSSPRAMCLAVKKLLSSDCFPSILIMAWVENINSFLMVWTCPGLLPRREDTHSLNTSDFLHYYWLFWCSYYSWAFSISRVTLGPNGLKNLLLTAFFCCCSYIFPWILLLPY